MEIWLATASKSNSSLQASFVGYPLNAVRSASPAAPKSVEVSSLSLGPTASEIKPEPSKTPSVSPILVEPPLLKVPLAPSGHTRTALDTVIPAPTNVLAKAVASDDAEVVNCAFDCPMANNTNRHAMKKVMVFMSYEIRRVK